MPTTNGSARRNAKDGSSEDIHSINFEFLGFDFFLLRTHVAFGTGKLFHTPNITRQTIMIMTQA